MLENILKVCAERFVNEMIRLKYFTIIVTMLLKLRALDKLYRRSFNNAELRDEMLEFSSRKHSLLCEPLYLVI